MNYDKGYFESPEFRELLAKYENSTRLGINSYFGIDEFVDLLSYYLSVDKVTKQPTYSMLQGGCIPQLPRISKWASSYCSTTASPKKPWNCSVN
jgi:hypothetical protein